MPLCKDNSARDMACTSTIMAISTYWNCYLIISDFHLGQDQLAALLADGGTCESPSPVLQCETQCSHSRGSISIQHSPCGDRVPLYPHTAKTPKLLLPTIWLDCYQPQDEPVYISQHDFPPPFHLHRKPQVQVLQCFLRMTSEWAKWVLLHLMACG